MKLLLVVVILFVASIDGAKEKAIKVKDKDMMRKMIIYDKVNDKNDKNQEGVKLKVLLKYFL